jgi:enamine deaminase RidA (YjgF/YER057c/UK114 family)
MTLSGPERRVRELGIELPPALELPPDQQTPARRLMLVGTTIYLSGNGPLWGSVPRHVGRLGESMTIEEGYQAARLTAHNHVRTLVDEGVDLDRVQWVKALGFVNVAASFDRMPSVINGFSDAIIELFGPSLGAHTRSAIGVASLAMGIPVEIEAICCLVR